MESFAFRRDVRGSAVFGDAGKLAACLENNRNETLPFGSERFGVTCLPSLLHNGVSDASRLCRADAPGLSYLRNP